MNGRCMDPSDTNKKEIMMVSLLNRTRATASF